MSKENIIALKWKIFICNLHCQNMKWAWAGHSNQYWVIKIFRVSKNCNGSDIRMSLYCVDLISSPMCLGFSSASWFLPYNYVNNFDGMMLEDVRAQNHKTQIFLALFLIWYLFVNYLGLYQCFHSCQSCFPRGSLISLKAGLKYCSSYSVFILYPDSFQYMFSEKIDYNIKRKRIFQFLQR